MLKRKLGDPHDYTKIDWAADKGKILKTAYNFENGEVVGVAKLFENGEIQIYGEITDEILGNFIEAHYAIQHTSTQSKKKIG